MSREFYDSPSRYAPDSQAQWGDVIYGPNGRPLSGREIDPGIYADMGNFNGDPGIYARSNFNGDEGMVIYPSRQRLGVDEATYQRMLYDAYDSNRGYDPRLNPNFASNWGPAYDSYERANYSYGPSIRLNLGPVQLNFGPGGRQGGWQGGYDRYGSYDRYGNYGEQVYRDRNGRPYQPDNYGWGQGSQWDRYGRDQYGWNDGRYSDRYDGYNDRWNDNYRAQQMQRMYQYMLMQMLQRQRQGQSGRYDNYGQHDRYGRDQFNRDPRYQYNDRNWQQGRDQYGRPYDLDQYGWGSSVYDRYRRNDQYGRYDQYDRYGRDQYGRYDQCDRYGRDQYGRYDQYDRYGRNSQYGRDPYWNSLAGTIQQMLGRSVREFDPRVPERLGCATFVSAALRHSFNLNIRDTNCKGLETSLRRNGFQQVDLCDLRPGDVIIGNRHGNQPGHAAIYAGDGQVAQNSSGKRRITVESANVFNSRSFQRVVAYRPNA